MSSENRREAAPLKEKMIVRASKGLPLVALSGLIFCGGGALAVNAWWPVFCYVAPWTIYSLTHYLYLRRFLREALWCMKIKIVSQLLIFMYSPSIAVWTILVDWHGSTYSLLIFILYIILVYIYLKTYILRAESAWEEKKISNYKFAIDPDTQTFRYDRGFNFGPIPGMWWDNLIFGTLLGLTTFSGALIGGLAVDLGAGKPLILAASVLWLLIWTRGSVVREIVSLQKIQEYEEKHGVTIRPR